MQGGGCAARPSKRPVRLSVVCTDSEQLWRPRDWADGASCRWHRRTAGKNACIWAKQPTTLTSSWGRQRWDGALGVAKPWPAACLLSADGTVPARLGTTQAGRQAGRQTNVPSRQSTPQRPRAPRPGHHQCAMLRPRQREQEEQSAYAGAQRGGGESPGEGGGREGGGGEHSSARRGGRQGGEAVGARDGRSSKQTTRKSTVLELAVWRGEDGGRSASSDQFQRK